MGLLHDGRAFIKRDKDGCRLLLVFLLLPTAKRFCKGHVSFPKNTTALRVSYSKTCYATDCAYVNLWLDFLSNKNIELLQSGIQGCGARSVSLKLYILQRINDVDISYDCGDSLLTPVMKLASDVVSPN